MKTPFSSIAARGRTTVALVFAASLLLAAAGASHAAALEPSQCEALFNANLSSLEDAPTTVISAVVVPAAGGRAPGDYQPAALAGSLMSDAKVAVSTDLPAYCRVQGIVAPQIQFELRLPVDQWNGKFLMQGCGGMCGIINMEAAEDVLIRGYATVNTNMGHAGNASTTSWALNNVSAKIDFGWRATHVVTLAAKALVEKYYGRPPRYSYFRGYSTGGRQAMVEAQRFPEDYNGIIAGAPPLDEGGDGVLNLVWSARASVDVDGNSLIDDRKIPALHAAVLKACDALDGVTDNVLQDPQACDWKPQQMQCKADNGPDCLTAAEVGVVERIYAGAHDSKGRRIFPGGMPRGSELGWRVLYLGKDARVGQPSTPLWLSDKVQLMVRYLMLDSDPGPAFSLRTLDFDTFPKRLRLVEPIYSARNPDLREFKAAGGKLLMFQGWNDAEVTPYMIVDYYDTATRTMGGPKATRDFFRLFMVPGMGHTRGGEGADAIDYLTALETWVEQGRAPDSLTAYHLVQPQNYMGLPVPRYPLAEARYDYVRPVFAYPATQVWDRKGRPEAPQSWMIKQP